MIARLFALALMAVAFVAPAQEFREGVHYKVVDGLSESNTPVVREFFSYYCGHCYRFDPAFKQITLALGDKVNIERTHVSFNRDSWKLAAKGFYISEILGVSGQTHEAFFSRIQQDGKPLHSDAELRQFFVDHGVSGADYDRVASSGDLKLKLADGDSRTALAKITGVPSVLVNGKYLVVNPGRTLGDYVELVQYLLTRP
ncbi:thiol:disulfide interchange protein DsbA/DsbL [Ferrimonas sediminicola]|uniref:Thiol:disulfide interchange protein n=1 Tax=Ferrimonas sediminicola TaxID=2569538 RepID=A0A4U1BKP5_9GAMM|nr:thiol:disulfide interchange protein DsbA/DsbL [Ferrimonas sediminicola]TKB50650.1 thiol:disulfide interchange protein DsbA/DsbL [Ferrimonas sediminicola]